MINVDISWSNWLSLRSKICIITHLSGGSLPTRKEAYASFFDISTSPEFSEFLPVEYNAFLWGPVSSQLDNAIEESIDAGYLEEYLYSLSGEPIHQARKLTNLGRNIAEITLGDRHSLEANGLSSDMIPQLSAGCPCLVVRASP